MDRVPLVSMHSPDAPLASTPGPPGPVVVFLHGYGSDERDLAGLAPYLPAGLAWASVRAPLRHPAMGYAWYSLDSEESWAARAPIDDATGALWSWVDDVLAADAPLIPVGFSQGGVMASQLLRTRPQRVAAAAILSGYVVPSPQSADAELAESPRPVFWGRGTADAVIPPHAVDATGAYLPGHSVLVERVYRGLPHSVSEEELADLATFLKHAVA